MKRIEMKKVHSLALALALVFSLGLFAGCSSQEDQSSTDPSEQVSDASVSDTASEDSAEDTDVDGNSAEETDASESSAYYVVGQVTGIDSDSETVTIQLYAASTEVEITDCSAVDMSQYSATDDTDEVDLSDATISVAQDSALTQTDISQLAVGDMVLLSYDSEGGTLLQAVIYAQSES